MRTRTGPLLAELHAHTRWSDGDLALDAVVDLYGQAGFDVLCITDHVVRPDDPFGSRGVPPAAMRDYFGAIAAQATRARREYDLLVVPGAELSWNDVDPDRAAHALAIGLADPVTLAEGLPHALHAAREAGAALVAAHPFDDEPDPNNDRRTRGFVCDETLRPLVDRFELFNRGTLFSWVARAGLHAVATGDFHRAEHIRSWKTLIPCERESAAVVAYLRSPRPVFLARLDETPRRSLAA